MTTNSADVDVRRHRAAWNLQRMGGIAALYAVGAYLVAIPYFLVLVDYPGAVSPADKVALLRNHHTSLYLMHLLCFEATALALAVVVLAVEARLRSLAPLAARLGAVLGILRSGLLLASVMIFDYGMSTVVELSTSAHDQATATWQAIEPVADALGGSGGEIMGGLWVLLVSATALRARTFPTVMNWLGLVTGTAGVLSVAPAAGVLEVTFGLLQIVWLLWLGTVLLRGAAQAPARPRGYDRA